MAEESQPTAQKIQNEGDEEEEVEKLTASNDLLEEDTQGPERQDEASSNHVAPDNETSRPLDQESDHTTPSCSRGSQATSPAFSCWHESSHRSEIVHFINGQTFSSPNRLFRPKDEDCGAWPSPSNPKCAASFGDHGTTATTGAFGQLIQLSDYLGAGNSGMFSADHSCTDEPYRVVSRAQDLYSSASEPFEQAQSRVYSNVFGLKFLNLKLSGDVAPRLRWLQYKWPRYEYKKCFKGMKRLKLTIQFIVRNRIVLQQCILENSGATEIDLELAFCKGMKIRDLDHVTDDFEFNTATSDDHEAGPGPGGFGWVCVNRFREEESAQTDSQNPGHEKKPAGLNDCHDKKGQPKYGVALVSSMTVNGSVVNFNPENTSYIWEKTIGAKSSTAPHRRQRLEIVTAYKLVLLEHPLSDWKTLLIPLEEMNVNQFLKEEVAVSSFRTSIARISEKDDLAYNNETRSSETLEDAKNEGKAGTVHESQDGVSTVESKPQVGTSQASIHASKPETSSTMEHIEFSVRRNLEHILGVCAIPVANRISKDAEGPVWERLRDVQPIALTCGDVSGHRISTTSSFFAFQFLAEVAKRLDRRSQPDENGSSIQILLCRIKNVCLGHLKWLYAAEKNIRDGEFGSSYWVDGEIVTVPESSESWVPQEHVRSTAFQIIKAVEFAESFNEDGYWSLVTEMISQWRRGWVQCLERSDRRESSTWYHREDNGIQIFRLDDHVWIWRALKAIERVGVLEVLQDRTQHDDSCSSTGSEASRRNEIVRRSRKFASRILQREVLQKFTMENDMLGKKMVALARSTRETRFLLHARDTALFYGEEMGFFSENALFQEVWKNTIDVQPFHEHNHESSWDNALRYALSIVLGIRGHQINSRKPEDMVRIATEVLLRSSSENGLFPGKLDIVTKGPLEDYFHGEEDADSCYEAGFEIPYILLVHAKGIEGLVNQPTESALEMNFVDADSRDIPSGEYLTSTGAMAEQHTHNSQRQYGQKEEDIELRRLLAKLTDILSSQSPLPISNSATYRPGPRARAVDARLALKKAIPFSNLIDPGSIVKIDDEWLFHYPSFFDSEGDGDVSIDETLDSLKSHNVSWLGRIHVEEMKQKYSPHNTDNDSTNVSSSDNNSDHHSSSTITTSSDEEDSHFSGLDIPSQKRLRGKGVKESMTIIGGSFESMWKWIKRPRTATAAKKRLIIWNRQGTDPGLEPALLCYAATKGDEKANMLEFFERHFQRENFMFDNCNLMHNRWETEVHLSLFILGDASGPPSEDAAGNVEVFPGVQGRQISRGSMGFRFYGDAFDRYWTAHVFFNCDPESEDGPGDPWWDFLYRFELSTSSRSQRKVLELILFSLILSEVYKATEEILKEVKSELDIKSGAFSWSIPSMDTYSSWSALWEGFAPLLQALVDDLMSTQDIIAQWEAREGDRGEERPRWTHNDERKYRADITRAQRVLRRSIKDIQDLQNDVESLRELCAARLTNARDELSFRSSQNIASFTYVTIVFLPLGFAASVFSMNGYPATAWVASMAVIAVVTLAITSIALANAKLLLGVAEQFSIKALGLTSTVFQSSMIGKQQPHWHERVQASPVPNKHAAKYKTGREQSHTWRHVLFWLAYLLIELPARRVALACRGLPASLMQSLGLQRPDATSPPPVDLSGSPSRPRVGRNIIRVTQAMLLLPLLFISWTLQLLFYNTLDILRLLGRWAQKAFDALVAPSDAHGPATDINMVEWLTKPPPSLRPVRRFLSHDEKIENSPPQAEVQGTGEGAAMGADRSISGSFEEV